MSGIVYVFQDHYPWDVRAEKFASSFVAANIPTTVVSRNRTGAPVNETLDGHQIRRLPAGWGGLIRDLLNFPAFFSPVWIGTIVSAAKTQQAELIVVRDLPLAPAAYWAGKIVGIPVIMDMAEDYPAMIAASWEHDGRGRFDFLVRNPDLLARLERWILPKLDGVIAVSEASAARVRALVNHDRTAVEVVGNTPRIDRQGDGEDSPLAQQIRDLDGLKLLYVGWVTVARGLGTVVEALPEISKRAGKVSLIVVGDGIGLQALRDQVEQAGLSESVLIPGWLDQDFVPKVVAAADICLVPHFVDDHINTTLPNKIYDYMFQARPVVVTHSDSLREVVEHNDCGLWYHDKNPQEFADAIVKLADANVRASYGERGRQAVIERLNWDADSRVLNRFVGRFIKTVEV